MKTTKKDVVASPNQNISILDRAYGYGALLLLAAGFMRSFVLEAKDYQTVTVVAGVALVLFSIRSVLRLMS